MHNMDPKKVLDILFSGERPNIINMHHLDIQQQQQQQQKEHWS